MYKPETVEENLANVHKMAEDFWWFIQKVYNDYNNFVYRFNYNGGINNSFAVKEYERDMQWLAYGVFGFTSDIYERLAYAVDCWRRLQDRRNKDNASDKQYDQSLNLLASKGQITGNMKEELLHLRPERNAGTHYGRIKIIDYVLRNAQTVYNFICIVDNLLSGYDYNELRYQYFMKLQTQFIQDMVSLFSTFTQCEDTAS